MRPLPTLRTRFVLGIGQGIGNRHCSSRACLLPPQTPSNPCCCRLEAALVELLLALLAAKYRRFCRMHALALSAALLTLLSAAREIQARNLRRMPLFPRFCGGK